MSTLQPARLIRLRRPLALSEASSPSDPDARMNPWTLRFLNPDVEVSFRRDFEIETRKQIRGTLVLVVVLYAGFHPLDHVMAGYAADRLFWLRLAVVFLTIGVLAVSFHPLFPRLRTALLFGLLSVGAAGLFIMYPLVGAEIAQLYYPGLAMAILAGFTIFRFRFVHGLVFGISSLVAFNVAFVILGIRDPTILINDNYFLIGIAVIGGFTSYIMERYARGRWWRDRALQAERTRSDSLLKNVLPGPIADRLKAFPGTMIADRFEDASILFADIVGYTRLAETMEPEEMVGVLNELFSDFDGIAAARGVEKIKTIGDSYMAAAGLPTPCDDHAERVADMALDLRDHVRRLYPSLQLRIGLAAGPVVAGVIGQSRFIYDLWSDAVVTASRMESQGIVGEIQVNDTFKKRVEDRYRFRYRGVVEIKGKGGMETWILETRVSSTSVCHALLP